MCVKVRITSSSSLFRKSWETNVLLCKMRRTSELLHHRSTSVSWLFSQFKKYYRQLSKNGCKQFQLFLFHGGFNHAGLSHSLNFSMTECSGCSLFSSFKSKSLISMSPVMTPSVYNVSVYILYLSFTALSAWKNDRTNERQPSRSSLAAKKTCLYLFTSLAGNRERERWGHTQSNNTKSFAQSRKVYCCYKILCHSDKSHKAVLIRWCLAVEWGDSALPVAVWFKKRAECWQTETAHIHQSQLQYEVKKRHLHS